MSAGWTGTAAQNSVQGIPQSTIVKRYIVIDTAQRVWTKQPNPYSNIVFAFGLQSEQFKSDLVYSNNKTMPTFARDSLGNLNTTPGLPNSAGWYFSNIFYPPYNPSVSPGPVVGTDNYYIQPSGLGFGSVDQASNVLSIRVIRVILPQRQFLNIATIPNNPMSATVQSNLLGKPFSTFSTYPYLLLALDTYYGQYYGGNEPTRRAFTALTQKTRTQTDFSLDVGVQHYDYEPWGGEVHVVQSPIPSLQKFTINLTDPVGSNFAQNDALSVSLIQADPSGGLFLKCFTGSYQYFSSNELRVGDRVVFDTATLYKIRSAVLTSSNKLPFVNSMVGTSFIVAGMLDYVPNANGIYVDRASVGQQRTAPYTSGYNGFLIPNFITTDSGGNATVTYPLAIEPGNSNVLQPTSLVGSNLPFLNASLQPVYTIELTCAVPDTTLFGQNLV